MKVIKTPEDYEKAKAALCQEQEEGYSGDDIAAVMLNYRRQHNIYEVGDKVVFINQNMSSSVKIIKEILNDTHVSFNFHGFHIELIRHAIDEEIKAGKRLEVANENISNHN